MRRIALLVAALAIVPFAPAQASSVATDPIEFVVANPADATNVYTVKGTLYRPATNVACSNSVMVLIHGLSYGQWAWDFPLEPDTYSVARALAARGFPAIAIDLPGYGASTKPDGHKLTVPGYADMVAQVVNQLRYGWYGGPAYGDVGLVGHSAGSEIAEMVAGVYGDIDAVVATGYTHFPSERIAREFLTGDYVRSTEGDYEYFGGTPENRLEYMYNAAVADPDVMALDNQMANLTPSGQIMTMGPQASRAVLHNITAPVMLVLAENDILFPVEFAEEELALFVGASDKALHVADDAGHSFMLHPNAPATSAAIADWLDARPHAIASCA